MDFVTNFASDKIVSVVPVENVPGDVQKQQPSNMKLRQEVAVRNCHTDQPSEHAGTKSFALT
jgi:hypothetical protein